MGIGIVVIALVAIVAIGGGVFWIAAVYFTDALPKPIRDWVMGKKKESGSEASQAC